MEHSEAVAAKEAPSWARALALGSPLLLYGAVALGMYGLGSGWAAIGGYHVAICIVLTMGKGWPMGASLVKGWRVGVGLALVAACLVAGPLIAVLWSVIRLDDMTMGAGLRAFGLSGWPWIAFIAYYSLVNPWLEELFWRGWYPTRVPHGVVSDLLFAGYHVLVLLLFVGAPWALLSFAVLVFVAFLWRTAAERFEGLLVPVAAHLAADVSIIAAAAYLALRG